jgi:hypothetical protein
MRGIIAFNILVQIMSVSKGKDKKEKVKKKWSEMTLNYLDDKELASIW